LEDRARIGQTTFNQYSTHLPSIRTVRNECLNRIGSV
jgi:hypothetical protein